MLVSKIFIEVQQQTDCSAGHVTKLLFCAGLLPDIRPGTNNSVLALPKPDQTRKPWFYDSFFVVFVVPCFFKLWFLLSVSYDTGLDGCQLYLVPMDSNQYAEINWKV